MRWHGTIFARGDQAYGHLHAVAATYSRGHTELARHLDDDHDVTPSAAKYGSWCRNVEAHAAAHDVTVRAVSEPLSPLRWHYGPTASDPEPGSMHCADCGGNVYWTDGIAGCVKCKREDHPPQRLALPEDGEWLDPEPPHAEHTVTECRAGLPVPREVDDGRAYRCGTCGRIYRAHGSEQREPKPYWVGPLRDVQEAL